MQTTYYYQKQNGILNYTCFYQRFFIFEKQINLKINFTDTLKIPFPLFKTTVFKATRSQNFSLKNENTISKFCQSDYL